MIRPFDERNKVSARVGAPDWARREMCIQVLYITRKTSSHQWAQASGRAAWRVQHKHTYSTCTVLARQRPSPPLHLPPKWVRGGRPPHRGTQVFASGGREACCPAHAARHPLKPILAATRPNKRLACAATVHTGARRRPWQGGLPHLSVPPRPPTSPPALQPTLLVTGFCIPAPLSNWRGRAVTGPNVVPHHGEGDGTPGSRQLPPPRTLRAQGKYPRREHVRSCGGGGSSDVGGGGLPHYDR